MSPGARIPIAKVPRSPALITEPDAATREAYQNGLDVSVIKPSPQEV